MTDRQLQVGQLVGGPEGVRVGVSVLWNKYPNHTTRQIKITVGTFLVYDTIFDETTRDRACQVLSQLLESHDLLCREFTGAIMEVRL